MSDALANAAPTGDVEAPGVPVDAPEVIASEVVEESAGVPDGYIEKARFDGLMGRLNREVNTRKQLEDELNSLRNAAPEEEKPQPVSDSTNDTLVQRVEFLTQQLLAQQVAAAKAEVFKEFPEAAAFAEVIQADSPEGLREMAQYISEKVRGVQATPAGEQPAPEAATEPNESPAPQQSALQTAPVVGGAASFSGEDSLAGRVQEAIKNKDWFGALQAKRELASLNEDAVLQE